MAVVEGGVLELSELDPVGEGPSESEASGWRTKGVAFPCRAL
jgi:hypothetical protein